MKQIKFIKEYADKKVGDIVNCSKQSAESAINAGYAEYVKEPKEEEIFSEKQKQMFKEDFSKAKVEEDGSIIFNSAQGKVKVGNVKKSQLEIVRDKASKFFKEEKYSDATEVLVAYLLKINHIYSTKQDKNNEIWIYDNGIYKPNGRACIKELLRKILEKHYNSLTVNQVLSKIEADTYIEQDEFFKQHYEWEVPVLNGILNVKTRELTEFTPKKVFFHKMPVFYDPNADCPAIEKFLNDILSSEEDKKVYYEGVGFGLRKDYFLEKSIMFIGHGRNGKGKALELQKRLYGIDNCSAIPLISLTSESFALSELFHKFINIAGDLSSTSLKDTGMFKSLTGRDLISAKRKFLTNIHFTNYAKMIFACNELPKVYDYSIGFWSRWILIEFPYRFVNQSTLDSASKEEKRFMKLEDPEIINKISSKEELSGLLNKALDGLDRLLNNKKFSSTKSTEEIKNMWIRKSDSFMAFCLDCLEEDFEGRITKKLIRKMYSKYCKEHKVKTVSDIAIKNVLQEMYGVGEEHATMGNYQEHCWTGIKLKEKINIQGIQGFS